MFNKYRNEVTLTEENLKETEKQFGAQKLKHFDFELDHVKWNVVFVNLFYRFF